MGKLFNAPITNIEKTPTIVLVNCLFTNDDQDTINMCAYELTRRLWVPNTEITFDQMLHNFGFRYIEQEEVKIKKLK